jgi:peptidoglycan hydrolase CwlO-like protein
MKKLLLISAIIVALTAAYAFAQMDGGMMGDQQGQKGQGGMMGGQGMMGDQQGQKGQGGMMGPGMMGGQQGQMGQGGMMGPGMMGGQGMGYDKGPGYENDTEKYQKFLDDTTKLRKELYDKRFEYFEAMRNPDTKQETISKLEQEIQELQKKLYDKEPG